jgi:NAD(P)-dependent dehydrogenase (short-subunit alcohol dehydrogenase family)
MLNDHEHELSGTSVVVTGGARGLGRAMTEALAAAGASVLVVDIDQEPIVEVLTEVPGTLVGHRADISQREGAEGTIDFALATFGSIDVLINNAGIGMSMIRSGDRYRNPVFFWEVGDDWMQRFYEVHVRAPYLLATAALPHMREREFGRIITVTTSLSTMLAGTNTPYGPMKAASEALCAAMSHDLAGSPITANVLVPGGAADTRYVPDSPGRPRDQLIQPVVMGIPSVFLSSRASDGVNGRRIIAKDWVADRSDEENLAAASAPIGWVPSRAAV